MAGITSDLAKKSGDCPDNIRRDNIAGSTGYSVGCASLCSTSEVMLPIGGVGWKSSPITKVMEEKIVNKIHSSISLLYPAHCS